MPQISKEQGAFVAEKFSERKGYIKVQAAFQQWFNQVPPFQKTIQQNVKTFHSHGTSLNRNK